MRILTDPEHALTKPYAALVESEGAGLDFTDHCIREMARIATLVNR